MLGQILRNATNPIIYVGYVVTTPHSEQYSWLVKDGNAKDIDPTDTDRWCEYIVYKVRPGGGRFRVCARSGTCSSPPCAGLAVCTSWCGV